MVMMKQERTHHTSTVNMGNMVIQLGAAFCLPAAPVEEKPLHKPTAGVNLHLKVAAEEMGTHSTVRGDNANET